MRFPVLALDVTAVACPSVWGNTHEYSNIRTSQRGTNQNTSLLIADQSNFLNCQGRSEVLPANLGI